MFCSQCGRSVQDGAAFCPGCGKKIGTVNRGAQQPAANGAQRPAFNINQQAAKPPKKTKQSKWRLVVIAIAALLVVAAVIVAAVLIGRDKAAKKQYAQFMADGEKYLEALDYERAETSFLDAIEVEPKEKEPYLLLADIYVIQERFDDAEAIIAEGEENCGPDEDFEDKKEEIQEARDDNENQEESQESIDGQPESGDAGAETEDADAESENAGAETEDTGSETEDEQPGADIGQPVGGGTAIFEEMPSEFLLTSGVGAWATQITLNDDGTFSGWYQDSNMGDTGSGYPAGTAYINVFTGKFTEPEQVGEYTYSMQLERLDSEGRVGDEYIENDIRYIISEPYGFGSTEEYLIYLPGMRMADLPDGFKNWLNMALNVQKTETLPYYGIYNVTEETGLVAFGNINE